MLAIELTTLDGPRVASRKDRSSVIALCIIILDCYRIGQSHGDITKQQVPHNLHIHPSQPVK
jgi:hypothetical protein